MSKASDAVAEAWVIEGPYPSYHRKEQDKLRRNWPTMYQAILALVHEWRTNQMIPMEQFLTPKEVQKARRLYPAAMRREPFADIVSRDIITPVIKRINEKLGQTNDPKFLAYWVEYQIGSGR